MDSLKKLIDLQHLLRIVKTSFLELNNIFPEIFILEEYEVPKESIEKAEYEDDFEEESKLSQIGNTARTDKIKKTILSRRYYLNLSHTNIDDIPKETITDNL